MFDYAKVNSFNLSNNGIQIIENEKYIEIYNDPFRTVPLFITRTDKNELIIFSEFEKYFDLNSVSKEVDETGFWEIVLFGSGLWTRTLYKNVKQMPAATCLTIDKVSEIYKIKRYWNYSIKENESIKTIEQAADGLHSILDRIFSKLESNKRYVLGMSGGLDSRITLAYLSKHIPKEKIDLFTFGFDKRILEFKYAKNVADALGIACPVFHKLTARAYRESLNYLPRISGGQVSINHCHIIDFLKTIKTNNNLHLSTYLTDALFGYECTYPKLKCNVGNNYYAEVARSSSQLKPETVSEIIDDSLSIFEGFDEDANFSSLDEYKYLTERNIKFHVFMAHLQNMSVDTLCIYANVDLLKYCMSMPIKFRVNKNIIDALLNKYFNDISMDKLNNISSRDSKTSTSLFQWSNKFLGFYNWHIFRILNRLNSILRIITAGKFQIINKFQTEEHERLLYSDFKVRLHLATSKLLVKELITKNQKKLYDKLPIRSAGVAERYTLISLAELL